MTTQSLYEKSLRSYLLTKYSASANTCLKAISSSQKEPLNDNLKLNIWTLYLNIATTLLYGNTISTINSKLLGIQQENSIQLLSRNIWNKIVHEGHQSNPGTVDARIISACLVMNLKLNQVAVSRDIAEEWFAALPDMILDHISINQENDQVGLGYKEVVQIYITRILTALNDYESATTFLQYNTILTDNQKKSLQHSLEQSIEREEQKKKQLEKEAKLAAEKKEKLKLEEEKRIRQKEEFDRKTEHEFKEQVVNEPVVASPIAAIPRSITPHQQEENGLQKWIKQVSAKGVATSGTILIFIFALFAVLRGQRGRLSVSLQSLLNKLWQTIKMGTKVTFM